MCEHGSLVLFKLIDVPACQMGTWHHDLHQLLEDTPGPLIALITGSQTGLLNLQYPGIYHYLTEFLFIYFFFIIFWERRILCLEEKVLGWCTLKCLLMSQKI